MSLKFPEKIVGPHLGGVLISRVAPTYQAESYAPSPLTYIWFFHSIYFIQVRGDIRLIRILKRRVAREAPMLQTLLVVWLD